MAEISYPSFDSENPSFDNPNARKYKGHEDPTLKAYAAYQDGSDNKQSELIARSHEDDTSYKSMTGETFDEEASQISDSKTKLLEDPRVPSLQAINFANLICYIANASIAFIVGFTNVSDIPTTWEVSANHPTLITPSAYTFSIWGVIFIAQLIWAVGQMLPAYRACDSVINGVGWNYAWICIAQIAWTGFFAIEHILHSAIAMVCILVPLLVVLFRLGNHPRSGDNRSYFLLEFPFEAHAAWIMVASSANASVLIVDSGLFSKNFQVVVAVISVLLLAGAGCFFAMRGQHAVPGVIGWGTLGIAAKLSDPFNVAMVERFPSGTITGIEFAAGGLGAFLWFFVFAKIYLLDPTREGPSRSDTGADLNDADGADEADDYVKL